MANRKPLARYPDEKPSVYRQRQERAKEIKRAKPTKDELREAIEKCNGTLISLAKQLGTPKKPHYFLRQWLFEHPELEQLFREKQREMIDLAEGVILEKLTTPGPEQLKAAMFVLERVQNDRFNPDKGETKTNLLDTINKLIDHAMSPAPVIQVGYAAEDEADNADK